jgi:hypothetical protein
MLIKELLGAQKEEGGVHLQPQSAKMPQEQQIAMRPLQIQISTHPKRSWKERFVLYIRRISSLPSVALIELYSFFRQFWLMWICWAILFFVLINRILTLLISAISRKYDL